MTEDMRLFRYAMVISSVALATLLSLIYSLSSMLPFSTELFLLNVVHLSIGFVFLLELCLMKMLGYKLFGHIDQKIQQSVFNRMTYCAFSFIFFIAQIYLSVEHDHKELFTYAFLFSIFLSGGIIYTMLQAISSIFKEKEEEVAKETVDLYGICYIREFETGMTKLSNTLFELSKMQEELSQEEIMHINEQTKEIQTLFSIYRKLSNIAKEEVKQDILQTIEEVTQKLDVIVYAKDEKYIRLIKRKTKRMQRKTV